MARKTSFERKESCAVKHASKLNIAVIMIVQRSRDILADVLTAFSQYTDKIFVLDTGFEEPSRDVCSSSASVVRYQRCLNMNKVHEKVNSLIAEAQESLAEDDWLLFVGDDEIPADNPCETVARASDENATSIVFDIADFYLTLGDMSAAHDEDPSHPIWERRLYYSIHSSAAKACRNIPHLGCDAGSLFPRISHKGNPLLRVASFRPVFQHYHFRSPSQIRACLEDGSSATAGCSGARPHGGTWFEYLIDERLLLKRGGTWRREGKSLEALKEETAVLSQRRLCVPTKEVDLKSEPLVSVIIPTFNRSRLLKSAFRSVSSQTYKNLEIIIVDDGSTDDTTAVAMKFPDQRITYVLRSSNSGGWRSITRNQGLKLSTGKYICYLDDDNMWETQHVQVLAEVLESWPHVGMVYCDSVRHYTLGKARMSEDFDRGKLLRWNFIDTGEIMHRRECLDTVGMWEPALRFGQDWEFCLRLSEKYTVVHVPMVLSHWFHSEDSIAVASGDEKSATFDMIRTAYKSGLSRAEKSLYFRRYPPGEASFGRQDAASVIGSGTGKHASIRWTHVPVGRDLHAIIKKFTARWLASASVQAPACVLKAGPDGCEKWLTEDVESEEGSLYLRIASEDDIDRLPSGRFGIVLAFGLLERSRSPAKVLAALRRILKPDGALCLPIPFDASLFPLEEDLQRLTPTCVGDLLKSMFTEVEVEVVGHLKSPIMFLSTARKRGTRRHARKQPVQIVLWFRKASERPGDLLNAFVDRFSRDAELVIAVGCRNAELLSALSKGRRRFSYAIVSSSEPEVRFLKRVIASTSSDVIGVISVEPHTLELPRGWLDQCRSAFEVDPELGWIGGGTVIKRSGGHERPIIQFVRRKACGGLMNLVNPSLRLAVQKQGFKSRDIAEILRLDRS